MNAVRYVLVTSVIAIAAAAMSCDPVHSDAITALGGEAPGVGTGPEHRGGQPCLLCHDGSLGSPAQFSIAGTVYEMPAPEPATPALGVTVTFTNINDKKTFTATTNQAGNFYVTPSQWAPSYPITVSVSRNNTAACMTTHVGREGSCAGCHVEPVGPASPGRVVLAPVPVDGGACSQ